VLSLYTYLQKAISTAGPWMLYVGPPKKHWQVLSKISELLVPNGIYYVGHGEN
jgi:hypothetical protein